MFTRKNKLGLSDVVAYVLLISITVSLSVAVYSWLRFYVAEDDVPVCSDGVSVIIDYYRCYIDPSDIGGQFNRVELGLKNKGRFTVDGFSVRVHNRTDAEFGFYTINETGQKILPGDSVDFVGNLSSPKLNFSKITFIEVQPFVMEEGKVSCKSLATQKLTCP